MTRSRQLLLSAMALGGSIAGAPPPQYAGMQLQARSNLIVNDNGWNLPPGSSMNSNSPDINDHGDVAFSVGVVPIDGNLSRSGAGIWLGGNGSGGIVARHDPPAGDPDAAVLIGDRPSINTSRQVAYYTSLDGGTYVLRRYNPATSSSSPISLLPLTPSSIANPWLAADGAIGFKGRFGSGSGFARAGSGSPMLYVVDNVVDGGSPYTFLFSPSMNASKQIAGKVSTDAGFAQNEIRLFDTDGSSARIVANAAIDAASPYSGFDNSLAVNAHGAVAVVARLAAGNIRVLMRFDPTGGGGYAGTEIARVEAAGTIRDIEFFAPAINDSGLVVFRGKDANGQAIYAGDGDGLRRVAGKGDAVLTDLGNGQIGQHIDNPSSWPIFSGAPALNSRGDVAFIAGLHPQGNTQVEWGSGVIVAHAAGDGIFTDGFDGPTPASLDSENR